MNYTYIKDSDGISVTGWRLFDVEEDGSIILISAGCPETFYSPEVSNGAYISEYILTGNKNDNAKDVDFSNYEPRDWSMYINSNYGATESKAFTKNRLDSWYTKYITKGVEADTFDQEVFQKIYGTKYESLIDNYSYYWLSVASYSNYLVDVHPNSKMVTGDYNQALGIRILVTLSPDTKLENKSVGTKTVVSRDQNTDYAVWNFAQ